MQARYPYSSGDARPAIATPAGACDCHLHAYDARYPAVAGAKLTPPDASMAQYRKIQSRLGMQRAVLVTPSTYGTDNRPMLDALAQLREQARGVAVIDGSETDAQLQAMHDAGVRGIRLNLSLGVTSSARQILPLSQRIAPWGWHLQLLMAPDRLAELAPLLADLPVPVVFDHMARLAPHDAGAHPAHALVLQLLARGRAWVKLSGGYLVSARHSVEDPALDALARSFLDANPERVVWGSDWPHASASAGMQPPARPSGRVDRPRPAEPGPRA